MDANRNNDANDPQAPAGLVEALRRMPSDPVFVRPAVDQRILSAARRHLEKPARRSRLIPGLLWPALAAVLIIGLWIGQLLQPGTTESRHAAGDLNRDGRVDIIDALILATRIHDGQELSSAHDLNGDGVVNHLDVESIAAEAVKLEHGRES